MALGIIAMGCALALTGCASFAPKMQSGMQPGTQPGMRPVMAMDGRQIDTSDPVENGKAMIMAGQFGLAADALVKVVSNDPHNARALTLLAVAYGEMKRFDLADRYHAEALQIEPDSVAALNNWGYSYLVRGDKARAAELLERAVAAGNGRPIVAANLTLLRDDGASPAQLPVQVGAAPEPQGNVRVSEHVTLVRPAGRLMRVAPGVQMLLTSQPLEVSSPSPEPARQASVTADPLAGEDTRFALFRALFALMEGQPDPGANALLQAQGFSMSQDLPKIQSMPENQIAAVTVMLPTPFGYFPEVDDFSRQ
jgi:tetratricopeptide (TPR) repeat protein